MALLATPTQPLNITGDPIACEICGLVTPLAQVHSLSITYCMPGQDSSGNSLPAYQCPALQHYACTHEHAVIAALACLFEHIDAGNFAGVGTSWMDSQTTTIYNNVEGYRP